MKLRLPLPRIGKSLELQQYPQRIFRRSKVRLLYLEYWMRREERKYTLSLRMELSRKKSYMPVLGAYMTQTRFYLRSRKTVLCLEVSIEGLMFRFSTLKWQNYEALVYPVLLFKILFYSLRNLSKIPFTNFGEPASEYLLQSSIISFINISLGVLKSWYSVYQSKKIAWSTISISS